MLALLVVILQRSIAVSGLQFTKKTSEFCNSSSPIMDSEEETVERAIDQLAQMGFDRSFARRRMVLPGMNDFPGDEGFSIGQFLGLLLLDLHEANRNALFENSSTYLSGLAPSQCHNPFLLPGLSRVAEAEPASTEESLFAKLVALSRHYRDDSTTCDNNTRSMTWSLTLPLPSDEVRPFKLLDLFIYTTFNLDHPID